jgi:NAD(P)-dependent dehydrogenase (short-subunit alcohol dehydrogenase family)
MRLDGKIAFVTGAGSGIGKCIAETYAREGARVALADVNGDTAKTAARSIGNNAIALRCDVSKKADIDEALDETVAAFGGLDILVNNAGATHVNKPLLEIGEAEYDRVFAVNVKGVFLACQAAVPALRKRGGGVIINIGSTAGLRPRLRHRPGRHRYAAAAVLSRSGAGHAGEVHRHNSDGSACFAAGHCRCGFVPRLCRGQIPHRQYHGG